MSVSGPTLKSERLILRPWRDEDLAPFAALNADPEVMRYFPATLDRAQSDALAGRIRESFAARGFGKSQLKNRANPLADENRRVQVINWTSLEAGPRRKR